MAELFLIDLSKKGINSNPHVPMYVISMYIPMIPYVLRKKIDVSSKNKKLYFSMPEFVCLGRISKNN